MEKRDRKARGKPVTGRHGGDGHFTERGGIEQYSKKSVADGSLLQRHGPGTKTVSQRRKVVGRRLPQSLLV